MEDDEVLATVQALFKLCGSILGKVEALQVTQDALIATAVEASPPLLDPLQGQLRSLAAARDGAVQDIALDAFRNQVANVQAKLSALR
ncbi:MULTISPECIES: hypothetical protein [Ramlibacter]|uniref:Uncharacterized protein n=1 Tax=Ramlibacter aquaticus TaxID=2780094 RepID=A0ABR9SCV9_9BURK|nr:MULTISPECIES: hypothetical protein [Ramlibacter]MBE7940193.1 hypothetical protein [Ramlibacter aquaticus]